MTASQRQHRFGLTPGKRPWVAILCLALLVLLAFVQVAHFHASDADAGRCTLCVTMHTLLPEAVAAAIIVLLSLRISAHQVPARVPVRRPDARRFIRPPPFDR